MPDIVIDPEDVQVGDHLALQTGVAGATVASAGLLLYADASDNNELKPASAADIATANAIGLSLHGAASGANLGYFLLQNGRKFIPGGTVVPGQHYGVSANGGGIAPVEDWTTDDIMTTIGLGVSATEIMVGLNPTGTAHP